MAKRKPNPNPKRGKRFGFPTYSAKHIFKYHISLKYIGPIPSQQLLNLFIRIQQIADGSIMVQSIYKVGNIFAHITIDVPVPFQKLRSLINQVGGQDTVNNSVRKGFVETFQAIGKEAEGSADENLAGFSFL